MNTPPAELVSAVMVYAARYGFDRVPVGLIIAQSALETGYWSSDVFRNGNNAFGLRLASVRDTPAVGEYAGHARYLSLADSALDYFDRQEAFSIPDTYDPAAYVAATVASGYATAGNYGPTWLQVYRERFDGFSPDVVAGTGATILALGLVITALVAETFPRR